MKSEVDLSDPIFDNPALLKKAYMVLLAESTSQQAEITSQHTIIADQQAEIELLKYELGQIKRMVFGSRSERFVPTDDGQLSLGFSGGPEEKEATPETETFTVTRRKKKETEKPGHARLPIPAHIPRVEHYIEPEGDLAGSKKIGEEITEVLEFERAKFYVNKFIRPKYLLPEDKGIVIGVLPSLPIPKGNAGASLLAQIEVGKFVDHLPFHRQKEIFKRDGVEIPESTMGGWHRKTCELITPLYDRVRELIRTSRYIQADESPMPVQTNEKEGSTHKGYQWVYHAVEEKLVCFHYHKSRSREGPINFLGDYSGVIQADGYASYDYFEKEKKLILLACMTHCRRKFFEAQGTSKVNADWMLEKIGDLYKIESEAAGYTNEQRAAYRQEKSLPVLDEMHKWLKANIVNVVPKNPMHQAIGYMLNQWPRLLRYIDNGMFRIDNNLIENKIRPLALGRKNYMFAGSHEGAQRAAVMYTMFGSCKLNGVEPYAWLKDVLERLPDTKMSEIDALLPNNWKPQNTSE